MNYMYVLGNHDSQADMKREDVMKLDMTHDLSMASEGPNNITGFSNYVVPIYD